MYTVIIGAYVHSTTNVNMFTSIFLCVLQKVVDMTLGAEIKTSPFS